MRKKYYIKYMENKYLKYKKKYLNLKKEYLNLKKECNKLTGGSETANYINELDYNQLIEVLQENLQNENTNNILLIVYAPWCHFCTEFLKNGSYDELIKETEGDNNIYVINGDKFSKELEDINLEILGFPTLFRLSRTEKHSENIEDKEILKEFNIVDYAGQSTDIKHIINFKNQTF